MEAFPTAASSRSLAAALADRLGPAVPLPCTVGAVGDQVEVRGASGSVCWSAAPGILYDDDGRAPEEKTEMIVLSVLSAVQDYVIEELAAPWPVTPDGMLGMPGARVEGSLVRLWFGDEATPTITFRPIEVAEIR